MAQIALKKKPASGRAPQRPGGTGWRGWSFGVLALVCAIVFVSLKLMAQTAAPAGQGMMEKEEATVAAAHSLLLLPGDLVFRRGRSLTSRAVLLADPAAVFSHVAIVTGEGPAQRLVHTVPSEAGSAGEAVAEALSDFLATEKAAAAAVFRTRPYDEHKARQAARAALSFVQERVPFDSDFDLESQESLYCTELVWAAYRHAGLDLTGGRRGLLDFPLKEKKPYILPSTLVASSRLERLTGGTFWENE